jgi:SLT domain-containing protein
VVIALKLWIGAQTILNGLLATFGVEEGIALAPLVGLAVAIIAVYAAVVILYAKWDEVWSFIGNLPWYAKVALAIVVITNPILLLIAIAATLAVYWSDIWRGIKEVVGTSVDVIVKALQILGFAWGIVWDAIGPIVRGAVQFALGWINDLIGGIERVVDVATRAANALSKLNPLGGGGSGQGLVDAFKANDKRRYPGFASGGIVTRPTLAMVGEAGPEVIIPLNRLGGGGTVIYNTYVTTTGLGASSPQIQSAVAAALRNHQDRNGL